MPGQEHAGPAGQLPAGRLPKDERCQVLSRFQLSTSRCRRLLWASPQHQADPGEPMVGEDTQHAPLWGGKAKRLRPVAKHGSVVMDLTRTRPVWSRHEAQQAETPHPPEPPAPTASRGDEAARVGAAAERGANGAGTQQFCKGLCCWGSISNQREPLGTGRGPAWCWSGWGSCRQASRLAAPSLTLGKG